MFEMLTGRKIKRLQGHFGQVNCLVAHHTKQVGSARDGGGGGGGGGALVVVLFLLLQQLL